MAGSLRAAIIQANASNGHNTIILPAGTYTLTLAGANEDYAATGDLDIRSDLTISGAGAATTIIDGGGLDRVFHVFGAKVAISSVTIDGGAASQGGGLFKSGGNVTLSQCVIGTGAQGLPGGDAEGGAIFNAAGTLNISGGSVFGRAFGGDGSSGGSASGGSIYVVHLGVIVPIIWVEPVFPIPLWPPTRDDNHAWSQARAGRPDRGTT